MCPIAASSSRSAWSSCSRTMGCARRWAHGAGTSSSATSRGMSSGLVWRSCSGVWSRGRPRMGPAHARPRPGARGELMRILMLAHRIPYPPHTGDKTRAFHIARHLAKRHDLTLAFLVDERADLAGLAPLREIIPAVEFGRLWKPWSLLKGCAGLAAGGPLSLPYFRSRALRRRLFTRLASAAYDVVYASSTPMAQYARALDL